MGTYSNNYSVLSNSWLKHSLFWACVFLYFMFSVNVNNYEEGYSQLFRSTIKIVIPQLVTAYVLLYVLIPRFLNTKRIKLFIFWLFVLLLASLILYITLHINFYEPKYSKYYNDILKEYATKSFWERVFDPSLFLSKSIKFLTPAALLLMTQFYKNQQRYLKLNEQKKTAELTALKHQLNPHFLFNTLNNLYALAIKKSDETPEVIEKLSDILDYMLYRTNETFVSIHKEIDLIENYLSLEKVRYGKRVHISFEKDVHQDVKIAPLLLLTFVENAFKHGVTQELDKATITIKIKYESNYIIFTIKNSKPNGIVPSKNDQCIGLVNVKKQLELLYLNKHHLTIDNTKNLYTVNLKLEAR